MLPLRDDEIESYNNQKFYNFCKKKFHDADDSNDDSNNDSE